MATNQKFKADDYISVNVGLERSSGEPFVKGALVGVLTTGSGSATNPVPDGKRLGVGNEPGWASVALTGGYRLPVAAGDTYLVGDIVYITAGQALTKTASGNTRFGVVTHEPKTSNVGTGFVVIKIGA